MILESFDSRWRDEISRFVNEKEIRREDIQSIVYDSERKCFTLFYWVKSEKQKDEDNKNSKEPMIFNTIDAIFDKAFNKENDDSEYNLYTDSEFFVFKKPYKMEINGVSYDVETWKSVTQIFLRYLYEMDKTIFMNSDVVRNSNMFSTNPKEFRFPRLVSDGLYFETNRGVVRLMKLMFLISDEFNETLSKDVRAGIKLFIL